MFEEDVSEIVEDKMVGGLREASTSDSATRSLFTYHWLWDKILLWIVRNSLQNRLERIHNIASSMSIQALPWLQIKCSSEVMYATS